MQTVTKISEIFVDISTLLFVSWSYVTYCENVRAAQPTAVHTVYYVIALNSVFSKITWVTKTERWLKLQLKCSKFSLTRQKLRLKVSWWLKWVKSTVLVD